MKKSNKEKNPNYMTPFQRRKWQEEQEGKYGLFIVIFLLSLYIILKWAFNNL